MKVFDFDVTVGDGLEIGGLCVFPLTSVNVDGPAYLTGPEAYGAGMIEVNELDPPVVPFVAITNLADVPILLVEGEMLVGGDQNRTMNVTVLCPPLARTVVPVSCVEAGRWGARRSMSASRRHAPGSLRAMKTPTSSRGRAWYRFGAPISTACGARSTASRRLTASGRRPRPSMTFRN